MEDNSHSCGMGLIGYKQEYDKVHKLIYCPHDQAEMKIADNNLYCPKCGFMIKISWLIETLNKLEEGKIE